MSNAKKRLKVTFFSCPFLEYGGGAEMNMIQTARQLSNKYPDLEVSIVTLGDKLYTRLEALLTIYYLKIKDKKEIFRENHQDIVQKLGKAQYLKADSFADLKKMLRSADVIVSKNELLDLGLLKLMRINTLPPIIISIHTPLHYPYAPSIQAKLHNLLYSGPVYKSLISDTFAIKTANEESFRFIRDKLKYGNVKLIYTSFDVARFKVTPLTGKKLKILFVGRLSEQKGIDILLDTISTLSSTSSLSKFEFRIAGSGEDELVESILRRTANFPNVSYLGHIENSAIAKQYSWADVVMVPSRYEVLPQVILEAAANGRLVVASNIPGPSDIITNNETGFLVELDSVDFSRKLMELSELKQRDPRILQDLGDNARQRVEEVFSMSKLNTAQRDLLIEAYEHGR